MSSDLAQSPVLQSVPQPVPPSQPVPFAASNSLEEPVSPQKARWTPERRAALSAKMKAKHQPANQSPSQGGEGGSEVPEPEQSGGENQPASLSPFALTDAHEFPDGQRKLPPQVDRVDIYSQHRDGSTTLIDSIPVASSAPPPLPGTSLSPFRRCPCLGVLPGRVCSFCYGTKWTKLCQKCEGEGRIHLAVRQGAERSQPCGHCAGKGTLPANMREVSEATRLAEEFDRTHVVIATPAPEFRRSVRLPGIGVTATKRVGTLVARKREKKRNAARKQARQSTKTAVA